MPFPKLQPMPLAFASGTTYVNRSSYDEQTRVETVKSSNFHEELPPAEMFDLDYMIKNKIPLEEVSSKILGKETLTIHKKTVEPSTTTEDKGE